MHIGFLTPEYPHPRTTAAAGIGTSIKNMAYALVEKGIDISVFVYGQAENEVFKEHNIKIHLIQQQNVKLFQWFLHRKFLQNYLNKYIALDAIDVIEAPDWTGITAFISLKCPLVIRMNGSDTYFCHLERRPQKKKNYWFEQIALQGADDLLSVSSFTARETRKLFRLNKGITIIPNSVDVQKFKPQSNKGIPNTVLYFGSIIRKKGVLELAAIFNKIATKFPETRLIVAGKDVVDQKTGRSTKALMEEIFSSHALEQVEWIGALNYDQITKEIAKANVVVLPSFAEALPMTWIEAMAMEKAMVTSDIGWAKDVMIDGDTGYTVDPQDHEDFAEKVVMLLKHPSLAEKMGRAARARVLAHFSTAVVTEKNIAFYKKLVE